MSDDARDSGDQERRSLHFSSLDDILADVQQLEESGYTSVGNWNLAQVCGHLREWMRYPLDGYPRLSLPLRLIFPLVRLTFGRRMRRRILANGSMSSGLATLPNTVPDRRQDETEAVGRLSETVERLKRHSGPFHPSPIFGDMARDEVIHLQLIHAAHHLSFLRPSEK